MNTTRFILKGRCTVLHAFDMGDAISLKECRDLLWDASTQQAARTRRAPSDFGLTPQPLVWEKEGFETTISGKHVALKMRAVIYDFGVVSSSLSFEFSGILETWRNLSNELYEHPEFFTISRQETEKLLEKIKGAVDDPRLADLHETYFLFQIDPEPQLDLDAWFLENRSSIAQTLRNEETPLSIEEIDESLNRRIAYSTRDLVLIDWNSAIIIDSNYHDTFAALEFANAQLLEMRVLDLRLDTMLEAAYRMIRSQVRGWREFFPAYQSPVRNLAELMADAAAEFEAVNNSIKMTNDQYLSRVYRLAAKRFHLTAFETDINSKLNTLWEIHSIFMERTAGRRLEVMEWIVILLIAFEIIKSFF